MIWEGGWRRDQSVSIRKEDKKRKQTDTTPKVTRKGTKDGSDIHS
jgi:hypothetical protein